MSSDEHMTQAARDVLAERRRQTDAIGWDSDHDDYHTHGELAKAAEIYCAFSTDVPQAKRFADAGRAPAGWPWATVWFRPTSQRRMLVKAGALILAEIERLDRASKDPAS